MDNPVDVFANVKATITEAMSDLSEDGEPAVIAIYLARPNGLLPSSPGST